MSRSASRRTTAPEELKRRAAAWNERHPVGTKVTVRDDGGIWQTTTRSEAWVLGDHTAIIMVEGGCIALACVSPIAGKP